jgi:sorbitol-specific phosphotransferase system component IIC
MLEDNLVKQSRDKELKVASTMREVISLSIMPIVGAFMLPLFSIINTGVCGYLGDPIVLAGYGLGSLAIAIFVVSMTVQLTSL